MEANRKIKYKIFLCILWTLFGWIHLSAADTFYPFNDIEKAEGQYFNYGAPEIKKVFQDKRYTREMQTVWDKPVIQKLPEIAQFSNVKENADDPINLIKYKVLKEFLIQPDGSVLTNRPQDVSVVKNVERAESFMEVVQPTSTPNLVNYETPEMVMNDFNVEEEPVSTTVSNFAQNFIVRPTVQSMPIEDIKTESDVENSEPSIEEENEIQTVKIPIMDNMMTADNLVAQTSTGSMDTDEEQANFVDQIRQALGSSFPGIQGVNRNSPMEVMTMIIPTGRISIEQIMNQVNQFQNKETMSEENNSISEDTTTEISVEKQQEPTAAPKPTTLPLPTLPPPTSEPVADNIVYDLSTSSASDVPEKMMNENEDLRQINSLTPQRVQDAIDVLTRYITQQRQQLERFNFFNTENRSPDSNSRDIIYNQKNEQQTEQEAENPEVSSSSSIIRDPNDQIMIRTRESDDDPPSQYIAESISTNYQQVPPPSSVYTNPQMSSTAEYNQDCDQQDPSVFSSFFSAPIRNPFRTPEGETSILYDKGKLLQDQVRLQLKKGQRAISILTWPVRTAVSLKAGIINSVSNMASTPATPSTHKAPSGGFFAGLTSGKGWQSTESSTSTTGQAGIIGALRTPIRAASSVARSVSGGIRNTLSAKGSIVADGVAQALDVKNNEVQNVLRSLQKALHSSRTYGDR